MPALVQIFVYWQNSRGRSQGRPWVKGVCSAALFREAPERLCPRGHQNPSCRPSQARGELATVSRPPSSTLGWRGRRRGKVGRGVTQGSYLWLQSARRLHPANAGRSLGARSLLETLWAERRSQRQSAEEWVSPAVEGRMMGTKGLRAVLPFQAGRGVTLRLRAPWTRERFSREIKDSEPRSALGSLVPLLDKDEVVIASKLQPAAMNLRKYQLRLVLSCAAGSTRSGTLHLAIILIPILILVK